MTNYRAIGVFFYLNIAASILQESWCQLSPNRYRSAGRNGKLAPGPILRIRRGHPPPHRHRTAIVETHNMKTPKPKNPLHPAATAPLPLRMCLLRLHINCWLTLPFPAINSAVNTTFILKIAWYKLDVIATCILWPVRIISKINVVKLEWLHNERDGVSSYQRFDYLLNRLFRRRSKKPSKLRLTGGFPSQRASYADNSSIRWRHHASYHSSKTFYNWI